MAKNQTPETAAFLQTLVTEAEEVDRFATLLKLEQTALSSGKTDELPSFAEHKTKLAVQLNTLSAQRNALLATQGFDADRAGVEAWCAKNPDEKEVAGAWSRILLLAGEARDLNRLNGELIQIRMQYNAKALEALQGGENSLALYGPDGQSTTTGNTRINDAV